MAVSMKVDMFGVHIQPLMAAMKRDEGIVAPLASHDVAPSSPLIVQTGYMLLRTHATEKLLEKFPVDNDRQELLANHWYDFEAKLVITRLHLTNILIDCEGDTLARKLVTDDDQAVYLDKRLLDIFGDFNTLQGLLIESVLYHPDYPRPVSKSPVRLSVKEGHTSGYVMAMQHVVERTWK